MTRRPSGLTVVESGIIDDGDCAFPQSALTGDGEVVCVYCKGGGQFATGVSVAARSIDGGRSWTVGAPLVSGEGNSTMLRASSRPGADTVFAYGARSRTGREDRFGDRPVEPIACVSHDRGHTWSDPVVIPAATPMLEISHGILPLADGRLLAPAATIEPGRLGAEVLLAESDDGGATWSGFRPILRDPGGRAGYLEHKLTELADGRILLTTWTIEMADLTDRPNTFCISADGGRTWGPPTSTGISGQTFSTVDLGEGDLLVLYNRRYGHQGVVAGLVRLTDGPWSVRAEVLLHDAGAERIRSADADGITEMAEFSFGFPTGIRLDDDQVLVTYWAGPYGRVAVRWARLTVQRC